MTLVVQLDHPLVQKHRQLLKPSYVWFEVCIMYHVQLVAILSSGLFYQDLRWSLIKQCVVLIQQICNPKKTMGRIVQLSIHIFFFELQMSSLDTITLDSIYV